MVAEFTPGLWLCCVADRDGLNDPVALNAQLSMLRRHAPKAFGGAEGALVAVVVPAGTEDSAYRRIANALNDEVAPKVGA